MMPNKITVYMPDDLYERIKHAPNLNLSAVCRIALAREMALAETEEEGLEVLQALYSWMSQGRKLLKELEEVLT